MVVVVVVVVEVVCCSLISTSRIRLGGVALQENSVQHVGWYVILYGQYLEVCRSISQSLSTKLGRPSTKTTRHGHHILFEQPTRHQKIAATLANGDDTTHTVTKYKMLITNNDLAVETPEPPVQLSTNLQIPCSPSMRGSIKPWSAEKCFPVSVRARPFGSFGSFGSPGSKFD
ncbi:hypothetical protein CERZMDRAFT_84783 [Cercospora zeae-maydis SCOH1-5]|uniref:Uncharacterized protein n=1 Tax=Cercospora zeae-maydis SCOH1-5 TaxID=717836 RepID=A0A6A6FG94_9PEZI|nr:hypothetical protein CERZMDRAFT_84783 [Cercospora zeae-maydis SCOH1-5]